MTTTCNADAIVNTRKSVQIIDHIHTNIWTSKMILLQTPSTVHLVAKVQLPCIKFFIARPLSITSSLFLWLYQLMLQATTFFQSHPTFGPCPPTECLRITGELFHRPYTLPVGQQCQALKLSHKHWCQLLKTDHWVTYFPDQLNAFKEGTWCLRTEILLTNKQYQATVKLLKSKVNNKDNDSAQSERINNWSLISQLTH